MDRGDSVPPLPPPPPPPPSQLPGNDIKRIIYWRLSWQMWQHCSLSLFLLVETFVSLSPRPSASLFLRVFLFLPHFAVVTVLYKSHLTHWEIMHSFPVSMGLFFLFLHYVPLLVLTKAQTYRMFTDTSMRKKKYW